MTDLIDRADVERVLRDPRFDPPRTLAFGLGPRSCPASAPALVIAGAIVEEVRAC